MAVAVTAVAHTIGAIGLQIGFYRHRIYGGIAKRLIALCRKPRSRFAATRSHHHPDGVPELVGARWKSRRMLCVAGER